MFIITMAAFSILIILIDFEIPYFLFYPGVSVTQLKD